PKVMSFKSLPGCTFPAYGSTVAMLELGILVACSASKQPARSSPSTKDIKHCESPTSTLTPIGGPHLAVAGSPRGRGRPGRLIFETGYGMRNWNPLCLNLPVRQLCIIHLRAGGECKALRELSPSHRLEVVAVHLWVSGRQQSAIASTPNLPSHPHSSSPRDSIISCKDLFFEDAQESF
ncbi:hypothetical protein CEXT_630211, partial [Caerostris extrusa]